MEELPAENIKKSVRKSRTPREPCDCKCHNKKPRATSTNKKPPSAAQLAQRENFKKKMAQARELKAEHPNWTREQIRKEVWGK